VQRWSVFSHRAAICGWHNLRPFECSSASKEQKWGRVRSQASRFAIDACPPLPGLQPESFSGTPMPSRGSQLSRALPRAGHQRECLGFPGGLPRAVRHAPS
jgi:hypothetical protein